MATQTLTFYTTGEGFTNLLTNFFEEGRFKMVYQTLEDGGLPHDMIVEFFNGRGYFEGDSRDEGGLSYHTRDVQVDMEHRYYWAMRNFITNHKIENDEYDEDDEDNYEPKTVLKYPEVTDALTEKAWQENEDLQCLRKIITRESLISLIWKKALTHEGWPVNKPPGECDLGAIIVRSGDVIECPYMMHNSLYPILYKIGLAKSPDWTEDEWNLHVSSGQISGGPTRELDWYSGRKELTHEQLLTLIRYRKVFYKMYSGWDKIMESIRGYIGNVENHGGKYNNLAFLKLSYPDIKLPLFSKEPIPGVRNCLRTSPKYSLPGLLESKFTIDDNSIREMEERFEKYKNIRKDNEFHYFYQEFIEGVNGVVHRNRSGFSYAVGNEQGDVVKGKKSNLKLADSAVTKLKAIADELFEDLDVSLQLEFVVAKNGDVYIVQLRKIENDFERSAGIPAPTKFIAKGRTFSKGVVDKVLAADVLIVDEDAMAEELIGKKALIVKSNVEFSHILALSAALKIPSIYGTGDFDWGGGHVKIQAYNEDGYISKL